MARRKVRQSKPSEAAVIAAVAVMAIAVVSAGFFVSYGYSIISYSVCGNFNCEAGENPINCPVDCMGGLTCGNGICDVWTGESQINCPQDCVIGHPVCPNGACEVWGGENPGKCPMDCIIGGPLCPNGVCEAGENPGNCPMDCGGGGQICGNNIVEGTEVCDGLSVPGNCINQGFTGGTLGCKADCTFNTSSCTAAPITQCGNGKVEGTEQCDDDGTSDGDGCDSLCKVETGWNCIGGAGALSVCTPICGDNGIKGNEICDGTNLMGKNCTSLGFTGGTLKCKADCSDYNTSSCTAAAGGAGGPTLPICGDNVTETGEDCDNTDMGGATCISQGFTGGTLKCNADCTFDTSSCTAAVCGNDKVEGTEVCDGTDLAGETCIGQGFTGGTLKCAEDCTLDTSSCISGAVVTAEDAEVAITKAQQDITTAQGQGKDITDATLKINEAKAALDSEDYATAKAKAEAASLAAQTATLKQAPGPSVVMMGVAVIILGVGAAAAYYLLKVNPDALKFGKKEPAPAPEPETSE